MSYKYYNPNPAGTHVGDCTVRAISKATGQDWEQTYASLSAYGFICRDMPNANSVWGTYLRRLGFKRHLVDEEGSLNDPPKMVHRSTNRIR